jgi:hypothetical protein
MLSRPQGHSETETIMSIKNSSDTMGNRTRNLPAYSAVRIVLMTVDQIVLQVCDESACRRQVCRVIK